MSTKGQSLAALRATGQAGTVDAAVFANVSELGPICRDALVKATGIKESTMCGALDRLMKRGAVVEAPVKVWNAETRRNVKAYTIPMEVPDVDQ